MNFKYKDLEWDTEYFCAKSARVDIKRNLTSRDIEEIQTYIKVNEFLTITNPKNEHKNNYYIGNSTKAYLVDVNIQLKMEVLDVPNEIDNISIENNLKKDSEILNIAKEAFLSSRFLNDKNIEREKSKDLYVNWIINAFEITSKYFVRYRKDNKTIGFILFSIQNNEIIIELIAVNKSEKNKGIGYALVSKLKSFASINEMNFINVGTQVENINAIHFYIKTGFKIHDIRYVYHVWNEEKK